MNKQQTQPLNAHELVNLAQSGHLSPNALHRAFQLIGIIPSSKQWKQFVWWLLLVLGVGFIVVGIFFFFAWNWADMSRTAKLFVVQLIIVGAVMTTWWQRFNIIGRVALVAASLLVGALFALYGQQYQSQADSWELFAAWAVFITGWVVIGYSPLLWFIWSLLINLSVLAYWQQVVFNRVALLSIIIFVINIIAVFIWEWAHKRYTEVTNRQWVRSTLVFALIPGLSTTPQFVIELLDSTPSMNEPIRTVIVIAYVMTLIISLRVYHQHSNDLPLLAIVLIFCIITGTLIIYRITSEMNLIPMTFIMCISVIMMGTLAMRYIQSAEQPPVEMLS